MKLYISAVIGLFLIISACKNQNKSPIDESPLTLHSTKEFNSTEIKTIADEIEKNSSIQLAEGFTAKIWASDSLVPDPIALQIDDKGIAYVTRTVRQKNSEFDIRGFEHWKIPSIALENPEERRNFLREVFASNLSSTNTWLADLNKDGVHDWKDLAVEKEEIHIIEDTDGDGMANKARGYMINMVEEITDIAGGLLVRARDAFLGMAPNVWRLTDTNSDGIWDTKKSISSGYAVHIGFGGHNVSGIVEGPDGKIYWGIGDIGSSIKDLEGNEYKNPNCGVLVRANPDGSDFEIIATGLRNTHEFAFDDYGNIISSDNDGDHSGESERLVHIVQGSDAGWRTNWQFGKYSDPKNNRYNVWMDEKLYQPHHKGQAAYIVPPIKNFHNGPTGFIYNPGTALGQKWLNKFFVVEFVGNPAQSRIWAFSLKPKGASFDLDTDETIISGILPTGIQFGPDGALYAADWVNGWDTKDYGRIWKIDVNDQSLAYKRKRTQQILSYDFTDLPIDSLDQFLVYEDKRVRQKAQFQLVALEDVGKDVLIKAAGEDNHRIKRIHALWGLGQIYRRDASIGSIILPYLNDKDDEVVVQAVKMLGDPKKPIATDQLINLLKHPSPRVVFHTIETLGRMKVKEAFKSLMELGRISSDSDLYIRHALVHSIAQLTDPNDLLALVNDDNDAARMISVLALRRMKHKGIATFINDKNQDIVAEVARGINDDGGIQEAMPALANLLIGAKYTNEVIMRRAINSAVRVGDKASLEALMNYALATNTPVELRKEALSALSSWHNPSVLDRVDGRYIGPSVKDSAEVRLLVKNNLNRLFEFKDEKELAAAAHLMVAHDISESKPIILNLYNTTDDEDLKSELLKSLNIMKYDSINTLVKSALESSSSKLRSTAISLIDDPMVSDVQLVEMVDLTFKNGSSNEQQQIIKLMAKLDQNTIESSLKYLIQNFNKGDLPREVELEFFTLIDSVKNDIVKNAIDISRKSDIIENYKNALYGGNARRGYATFTWNSSAMCVRCHKVNGEGSDVGPDLTHIGSLLSREQLLEALIKPDARIAPGYGTAIVTLNDGVSHTGVLIAENQQKITLKTADAEPLILAMNRVKEVEMLPSSMPDASKKISLGEIRDLVEYLTTLR